MIQFDFEKNALKILFLLLMADFAFMVLHLFYEMSYLKDISFWIGLDWGYAEVYQYIKEFWIAVLLLMLAVKRKALIHFAWVMVFVYLLLDDSLQIHETVGHHLADRFDLQRKWFRYGISLRGQDLGELSVSLVMGILFSLMVGMTYLVSDHSGKKISRNLIVLLLGLAVVGVFGDMLSIAFKGIKSFWEFIEDGGEMIMMSLILWYVFNLRLDQKGFS